MKTIIKTFFILFVFLSSFAFGQIEEYLGKNVTDVNKKLKEDNVEYDIRSDGENFHIVLQQMIENKEYIAALTFSKKTSYNCNIALIDLGPSDVYSTTELSVKLIESGYEKMESEKGDYYKSVNNKKPHFLAFTFAKGRLYTCYVEEVKYFYE